MLLLHCALQAGSCQIPVSAVVSIDSWRDVDKAVKSYRLMAVAVDRLGQPIGHIKPAVGDSFVVRFMGAGAGNHPGAGHGAQGHGAG